MIERVAGTSDPRPAPRAGAGRARPRRRRGWGVDRLGTRATRLVGEVAVQPTLTDDAGRGDPAALAAVDQAVRTHVVRGSLVRVKLWDRDGRIFYSDEARLIGEHFTLEDDERAVFDSG